MKQLILKNSNSLAKPTTNTTAKFNDCGPDVQ